MNHMIRDEVPELTQIVGIEMAGVPLVSAIGTAQGPGCGFIPYSYTRPLPGKKARNPAEAKLALDQLKELSDYGQKELVEGRFYEGDVFCITDDMVTDLGSKLIAKLIVEWEMEKRGIRRYDLGHVAVVLDREQGGTEEARKNGMFLHSLIKFKTDGLNWLKGVMRPEEHALISDYQSDPKKYMDKSLQEKVLAEADRIRGK
jgi:hypothetical protein